MAYVIYWKDEKWHDVSRFEDVVDALYPFDPKVEAANLRKGLRSDRRGLLRNRNLVGRPDALYCPVEGTDIVGAPPGFALRGGLWMWDERSNEERIFELGSFANRQRMWHEILSGLSTPTTLLSCLLLRADHPAYTYESFPLGKRRGQQGTRYMGRYSVGLFPVEASRSRFNMDSMEPSPVPIIPYLPFSIPSSPITMKMSFTVLKNRVGPILEALTSKP